MISPFEARGLARGKFRKMSGATQFHLRVASATVFRKTHRPKPHSSLPERTASDKVPTRLANPLCAAPYAKGPWATISVEIVSRVPQRFRGLGLLFLSLPASPCFDLVSAVGLEPTTP
jgi:hypothetical protein